MANVRAPEIAGSGGWTGTTEPLSMAALRGKIVLLHFFTSSCINCVRVIDELRELERRFDTELVVLGVHSPKFPAEHEHVLVSDAVMRLQIAHPVLDDPELVTWDAYGVRAWPTLVLVDPNGYVVGSVTGEGAAPLLAEHVQKLVDEHHASGALDRRPLGLLVPPRRPSSGLSFPGKVAVSVERSAIAIADTGHDRVVVIGPGGVVTHVFERFTAPQGVRFDGRWLVVCDTGADRVVRVDLESSVRSLVIDDIASPWDVVVDHDGSYVVAEAGRHRLWRVDPTSGMSSVFVGTGEENLVDGPLDRALLAQPSALAVLPTAIAFLDAESSSLRTVGNDGRVRTLIGEGLFTWGHDDGDRAQATMQHPMGLACTTDGEAMFIADTFNNCLRRFSAGVVETLPIEGLRHPGGIDALPDGNLVVADTGNHRVLLVDVASATVVELPVDIPAGSDTDPVADEGPASAPPMFRAPSQGAYIPTSVRAALSAKSGALLAIDVGVELGEHLRVAAGGSATSVELVASPVSLLAPGSRSWTLSASRGRVQVRAGTPGEGQLIVDVRVMLEDRSSGKPVERHERMLVPFTVLPA